MQLLTVQVLQLVHMSLQRKQEAELVVFKVKGELQAKHDVLSHSLQLAEYTLQDMQILDV